MLQFFLFLLKSSNISDGQHRLTSQIDRSEGDVEKHNIFSCFSDLCIEFHDRIMGFWNPCNFHSLCDIRDHTYMTSLKRGK